VDRSNTARAFPSLGVGEDPVTGSLNAGLAQWLVGSRQPTSYVASPGPSPSDLIALRGSPRAP
jgi:predicted PhzF superfamily epimerase YddE/YHI9